MKNLTLNKPKENYELVILTEAKNVKSIDDGYWMTISRLPSNYDHFMISTNDRIWSQILSDELGYDQFSNDKEVLENRMIEFATRHNLPLKRHIKDGKYTLIEASI